MIHNAINVLHQIYANTVAPIKYRIILYLYWLKVPWMVKKMREKQFIRVLFVTGGVRGWKASPLFLKMLEHPRFSPIIGVKTNTRYPETKRELMQYIESNRFEYIDLDFEPKGIRRIHPDIIIYSSPYKHEYTNGVSFDKNLQYLFCGCDYCINITKHVHHLKHEWYDFCWQFYVEHEDVKKRKLEIYRNRARNIRVTGVPFQDELLLPISNFSDPWKDRTGKKRIIYAPHHSFEGSNGDGIEFATFLVYYQFMLDMACKYIDKITIAFKPHPSLYIKLLDIWGKDRTDAYYDMWRNLPNTQFENGQYVGLFKYSDAIIHDCASFIIEYLYMDKPSLYLVAGSNNIDDMFDFVKDAYNCYDYAYNKNEIEQFINNVIDGRDENSCKRKECINKHLLPPNGRCACDNIIDAILND